MRASQRERRSDDGFVTCWVETIGVTQPLQQAVSWSVVMLNKVEGIREAGQSGEKTCWRHRVSTARRCSRFSHFSKPTDYRMVRHQRRGVLAPIGPHRTLHIGDQKIWKKAPSLGVRYSLADNDE